MYVNARKYACGLFVQTRDLHYLGTKPFLPYRETGHSWFCEKRASMDCMPRLGLHRINYIIRMLYFNKLIDVLVLDVTISSIWRRAHHMFDIVTSKGLPTMV